MRKLHPHFELEIVKLVAQVSLHPQEALNCLDIHPFGRNDIFDNLGLYVPLASRMSSSRGITLRAST